MRCETRQHLQNEYKESTLALGKYDESLEGVARLSEHQLEIERLEKVVSATRQALLQHEEQHGCRLDH